MRFRTFPIDGIFRSGQIFNHRKNNLSGGCVMVFLFILLTIGFALLIDYLKTRQTEKKESFSTALKGEKNNLSNELNPGQDSEIAYYQTSRHLLV